MSERRFCENCGAELSEDQRFCEQCGVPLADFAKPAAPAPAVTTRRAPQTTGPAPQAVAASPEAPVAAPFRARSGRLAHLAWASAAAAILLTVIGGYWLLGREPARLIPPETTTESPRSAVPDASYPPPGDARPTEIGEAAQTPAAVTAVPASPELPPKPLGFEALGEVGETARTGINHILAVFMVRFDGPVREGDVAELDILANGTSLGAAIEASGKREFRTPDNLRIELKLGDILRAGAKFLPETGIMRFECILAMRGGKRIVAPSAFDFLKWEEVPEASFGDASP